MMTTTVTMVLLMAATCTASISNHLEAPAENAFQCKLSDDACLQKYLQDQVIGRFSAGFPEYGVKPFDPLHFDELTFDYDSCVGLKVTLKHQDAILYGLSKIRVLGVRTNLNGLKFSIDVQVSIPKLFYEGTYTMDGGWLLLPIHWNGYFNMSLGDISDTWSLRADVVQKGKDTYLDLQEISLDPQVNAFSTYATGLFDGLEEAGELALKFTNRYWKFFYGNMWSLAEPVVVKTVSEAASSIFAQTPVNTFSLL